MNQQHSWDRTIVESIAHALKDKPGALMPILRRIQDELGWVPRDSVPVLAEILNLTRAEVHGVLSFYHDFRHEPPGRVVVKVCRAESCQEMGGVALAEQVGDQYGPVPYAHHMMARIYAATGNVRGVRAQLDTLLARPYFISRDWVRIDPTLAPAVAYGHP